MIWHKLARYLGSYMVKIISQLIALRHHIVMPTAARKDSLHQSFSERLKPRFMAADKASRNSLITLASTKHLEH